MKGVELMWVVGGYWVAVPWKVTKETYLSLPPVSPLCLAVAPRAKPLKFLDLS